MELVETPSVLRAPAEAIAVGATAGLAHGVTETAVLAVSGTGLEWFDGPLLAAVAAGGWSLALGVTAMFLWPVILRRDSPVTVLRRVLVMVVGLGYLATLAASGRHAPWRAATLLVAAVVLLLSAGVWHWLVAKSESFGTSALALTTTIAACIVGSVLVQDDARVMVVARVSGRVFPAVLFLILIAVPCAASLVTVWRGEWRGALEPGPVVAGLAGLLVWSTLLSVVLPRDGEVARGGFPRHVPAADAPPSIVLIVLDTVAARHLELFGYTGGATMPRLTRFAEEECDVVMTLSAPSPWTPPTHASMFTGMWPAGHGCRRPGSGEGEAFCLPMRDDVPTLAEWLGGRGYRCGGIAANHAVLGRYGLGRGFHDYDATPGPLHVAEVLSLVRRGILRIPGWRGRLAMLPEWMRRRTVVFDAFRQPWRSADEINRLARAWITDRSGAPYFLFLNYMDAHGPYMPRSQAVRLRRVRPEWLDFPNRLWERYHARGEAPPADLVRELSALYDLALRDLDADLGEFLDYLRTLPEYDRLLLIITSDHGEEFMEHGDLEHSTNVFEPQISVPMLIRLPRPVPRELPRPSPAFQHVDLFATIASVLGTTAPDGTPGQPWGAGRGFALSEVFSSPRQSARYAMGYKCVGIGGYKYIRASNGHEELYDVTRDPDEQHDLMAADPEAARHAREILRVRDTWITRLDPRPVEGDPREIERLRSLGYVH